MNKIKYSFLQIKRFLYYARFCKNNFTVSSGVFFLISFFSPRTEIYFRDLQHLFFHNLQARYIEIISLSNISFLENQINKLT